MQTVLYSLSVNIHRVVFLISKCLKCYQIGRKIFIKGGVVVGGGGAGINKSHNSFQSLKAFFSLWSHVRLNTGDGDRTFILPMGCLQTVDFTSCLRCFLFTSDISKREKKALPPLCASAFFWVVFFPPSPVLCPLPALFCARIVLHVPLGRLRKSRCCWSDSSDLSVNVTATFFKFHSCFRRWFFKNCGFFYNYAVDFFFHNEPSLYRAAYLKKNKQKQNKKFFPLFNTFILFFSTSRFHIQPM